MITFVNSSNSGIYGARFAKATLLLQSYDEMSSDSAISTLEEYFLYLKELANHDVYYTMLPIDEDTFDIDANTRKISIPESFAKNGIGVQGDEIAEIVYFTIDRFFDATDLNEESMNIAIQWEAADGTAGVSKEFIRDVTSLPGKIIFGWPLVSQITSVPGNIKFSVRFYKVDTKTDSNGISYEYLSYNFNTLTATVKINSSLDYKLYGDDKLSVIDSKAAIVNRIVDSTLTDVAIPDPEAPVWHINLATRDTLTNGVHGQQEVDISAFADADGDSDEVKAKKAILRDRYLVKDLYLVGSTTANGIVYNLYGYPLEAYATSNDGGVISYDWGQIDLDEFNVLQSLNRNLDTIPSVECKTDSNVAAKIGTTGSVIQEDSYFQVYLQNDNLVEGALTLNINAQGEKPIYIAGEASSASNATFLESGLYLVYFHDNKYYFGVHGSLSNSVIVNNSYYTVTKDTETSPSKIYYQAIYNYSGTDVVGLKGYEPFSPTTTYEIVDGKVTINGTQTTLYEKHSSALAIAAGMYHVIVKNRRLGKAATEDSYEVYVPMPHLPVINEAKSNDTISYTNDANYRTSSFKMVNDEAGVTEDNEVVHVLLDATGTARLVTNAESPEFATEKANNIIIMQEELSGSFDFSDDEGYELALAAAAEQNIDLWPTPGVTLSYQWYHKNDAGLPVGIGAETDTLRAAAGKAPLQNENALCSVDEATGRLKIESSADAQTYAIPDATEAVYELAVADPEDYDQIFYVKDINNRNRASTALFAKPYRVTPAPKKPVLYDSISIDVNINEPADGSEPNLITVYSANVYGGTPYTVGIIPDESVQTDGYTYQWVKFTASADETTHNYGELEGEGADVIVEGATTNSLNLSTVDSGYYYCIVTNHLNGVTNSIRTQMYVKAN